MSAGNVGGESRSPEFDPSIREVSEADFLAIVGEAQPTAGFYERMGVPSPEGRDDMTMLATQLGVLRVNGTDLEAKVIPLSDVRALADEQMPPAGSGSFFDRMRGMSARARTVIGLGTAGTVLGTSGLAFAAGFKPFEEDDTCTDETHASVRSEDWNKAADKLTDDRGYRVYAGELAGLNTVAVDDDGKLVSVRTLNGDGTLKPEMGGKGEFFCMIVPAPVASGQIMTNGKQSLKQIAYQMGVPVSDLTKFNKGVVPSDPDKPVPEGIRLWTQAKVDTGMVLQRMQGNLQDETNGSGAELKKILNANIQAFTMPDGSATNVAFLPGGDYYLAFDGKDLTAFMNEHGLTPDKIIKAFAAAGSFDYKRRGDGLVADAAPTATKGAEAPGNGRITAEQRKLIEQMNLSAEQRKFVSDSVDTIMQLRELIQKSGINPNVMLAQAILESGYGTSDKVPYHNYFGMKANGNWTGPVTPPLEADGAGKGTSPMRVYSNMYEGFKGYIDNLLSKNWYNDARQFPDDDNKYILGLLGSVDADGDVLIAQNQDGAMSYAVDPEYRKKLLNIIDNLNVDALFSSFVFPDKPTAGPTVTKTETSKHKIVAPEAVAGNVHIDQAWYKKNTKHQGHLTVNSHPEAYVIIDGQRVALRDLDDKIRIRLIENALNGVKLSVEGYNDFVANYKDVSAQVAADNSLTNFQGQKNGLGLVENVRQDIKYFVWHYTATRNAANGVDGMGAARQMQNGGNRVGSWGYINDKGEFYQLVDNDHVVNVLDYNYVTWGVEMAGGGQESLTAAQYTSMIYVTAKFLIENGYVQKGQSVTKVVNDVVRGHGEFSEFSRGDHGDNTSMVMDQTRPMVINLLTMLGYTK